MQINCAEELKNKMASDTSGSEYYYEHSVQSEEEYDDELISEQQKVQVRGTRSKKRPARYREALKEAFQSKEEELAVEMKDSKLLMCTYNCIKIKLHHRSGLNSRCEIVRASTCFCIFTDP